MVPGGASSVGLVLDFAVHVKAVLQMLFPFRAETAVCAGVKLWIQGFIVAGLSCWPWPLMAGCLLTNSAGMFTVLCPVGEGGPI